jgi:dCTP deaminase
MSFWSSEKLVQRQKKQTLIDPFDVKFAKHGAYELALGSEAFITSDPSGVKQKLESGAQLVIPSGQFALLLTDEIVTIPNDAIGFISVRFTIKRRGLVNVSGFHVDPGFSGRLQFAVYNAGSQNIILSRGDRVFMIWFGDLSEATADVYDGKSRDQKEIASYDIMDLQGAVASPAVLKKQIDDLQKEIGLIKALALGIFFVLLTLGARACLDNKQVPTAAKSPGTLHVQSESNLQKESSNNSNH